MNKTLKWMLCGVLFVLVLAAAHNAEAQERVWVQVEARPSLREAEARARAYSGLFANVNGFRLSSGWYAIALGPYAPQEGARRLEDLRREGLIPGDSYLADGRNYGQRFWPVGLGLERRAPEPSSAPRGQSIAEALAAESSLSASERVLVQEALSWEGFYDAALDGAFGSGTRSAMASWQAAQGYETTGVLTAEQRAELLEDYEAARAELRVETVRDEAAGVEITLPLDLVSFDRYEPPFAYYTGDSGVEVRLISQQGDEATLAGLYRMMQTLDIVPAEGTRSFNGNSFILTGDNGQMRSYTRAVLREGTIRGFTLVWPADAAGMEPVLQAMQRSFTPFGSHGLEDQGSGPTDAEMRALLEGIDIRRPIRTGSGFYMDEEGLVLTSAHAVGGCTSILIDEIYEASVLLEDEALGIAVLQPDEQLAPRGVARFRMSSPRLGAQTAVAGYSFGEMMTRPALTFGELAERRDPEGDEARHRLALSALPGDVGGPVYDASGAVIGVLLPRPNSNDRLLPEDVAFAAPAPLVVEALRDRGLAPAEATGSQDLDPVDLARRAEEATVLVTCRS